MPYRFIAGRAVKHNEIPRGKSGPPGDFFENENILHLIN
jgi:hypothetical protein